MKHRLALAAVLAIVCTVAGASLARQAAAAPPCDRKPDHPKCHPPSPTVPPQPSFPITGAFYYPWYDAGSWTQLFTSQWRAVNTPTHWGYASDDAATQTRHINDLVYARQDVAVSSWFCCSGDYRDQVLRQMMDRTVAMGVPLKWAVLYEDEGDDPVNVPTEDEVVADFTYIRNALAPHGAYLRVGGKPVVFVWSPGHYHGDCSVADADPAACANAGALMTKYDNVNRRLGEPFYLLLKAFNYYQRATPQPEDWYDYFPQSDQYKSSSECCGNQYFSVYPGFWFRERTEPDRARCFSCWQNVVSQMAASSAWWKLTVTYNEIYEGSHVETSSGWESTSGHGSYLDELHNRLP